MIVPSIAQTLVMTLKTGRGIICPQVLFAANRLIVIRERVQGLNSDRRSRSVRYSFKLSHLGHDAIAYSTRIG